MRQEDHEDLEGGGGGTSQGLHAPQQTRSPRASPLNFALALCNMYTSQWATLTFMRQPWCKTTSLVLSCLSLQAQRPGHPSICQFVSRCLGYWCVCSVSHSIELRSLCVRLLLHLPYEKLHVTVCARLRCTERDPAPELAAACVASVKSIALIIWEHEGWLTSPRRQGLCMAQMHVFVEMYGVP